MDVGSVTVLLFIVIDTGLPLPESPHRDGVPGRAGAASMAARPWTGGLRGSWLQTCDLVLVLRTSPLKRNGTPDSVKAQGDARPHCPAVSSCCLIHGALAMPFSRRCRVSALPPLHVLPCLPSGCACFCHLVQEFVPHCDTHFVEPTVWVPTTALAPSTAGLSPPPMPPAWMPLKHRKCHPNLDQRLAPARPRNAAE